MPERTRYQAVTLPADCLAIWKGCAKFERFMPRNEVVRNALYAVLFRLEANKDNWKATNLDTLIRSRYRWLYKLENTSYYADGEIDGLFSRLLTVPDAPKRQPLTVAAIRFYALTLDWSILSKDPTVEYNMDLPADWWATVAQFHWIDQAAL